MNDLFEFSPKKPNKSKKSESPKKTAQAKKVEKEDDFFHNHRKQKNWQKKVKNSKYISKNDIEKEKVKGESKKTRGFLKFSINKKESDSKDEVNQTPPKKQNNYG